MGLKTFTVVLTWLIVNKCWDNFVVYIFFVSQGNSVHRTAKFPQVGCSYVAPDQCSDFTPPTCCERVGAVEDGGVVLRVSLALAALCLLTAFMG